MMFWSVGCFESKLPWSLTFVCFSSYDLVASPFAVVLCRVGNYYWESRCTMVVINLIGMGFVFPIFNIFLSPSCLRIVLLAFVDLHRPLLSFVRLFHWSSSSFVSLCWPALAFVGLYWPALACVGLRWPTSACIGLCRPLSTFIRKWQFLIMLSTESNHKREGMVGEKAQNLDYVIHGWSCSEVRICT